ncbi:hypothetical protein [Clostridium tagluense]|uniref:Uncharacterized protein n=1 Tax=Clostridium tagluense TaxID=360422 RepID=A0A401UQE0_9CLOT|nr:hypothetical protein [Clostridium tagluense]GCD11747.1 hypothetical protein Ctaglu_33700 [Clostridium tagluense]
MYNAYITRIKDIRKHSNADRLQVGECFGNSVIVSLETQNDELIVYFPTDGRLSMEYCEKNNLLRKKDANGVNIGGYLDASSRHVSTIRLRKEQSDGLVMPLKSLETFCDISKLKEGDIINSLNGILICEKYVPFRKHNPQQGIAKEKIIHRISYPFFKEHSDTSQLAYSHNAFKKGDLCYITLKQHGTSQRTSYSIKEVTKKIPSFIQPILKALKIKVKPKRTLALITGTRRVVLSETFDSFRKPHHDFFTGKLRQGETVFCEIVGYENDCKTIMPECSNKKQMIRNL